MRRELINADDDTINKDILISQLDELLMNYEKTKELPRIYKLLHGSKNKKNSQRTGLALVSKVYRLKLNNIIKIKMTN